MNSESCLAGQKVYDLAGDKHSARKKSKHIIQEHCNEYSLKYESDSA